MTNTNSSTAVATRPQFHFSDGRCRHMLRSPAHSFFCAFDARQELQLLESRRLGGEISASLHGDFLTATDINHVLGKLFIAVAQDRVPLRKATALALLGKAMLSSLPHVKQEFPSSTSSSTGQKWWPTQRTSPVLLPHRFQYFSRGSPRARRTRLQRRRLAIRAHRELALVFGYGAHQDLRKDPADRRQTPTDVLLELKMGGPNPALRPGFQPMARLEWRRL